MVNATFAIIFTHVGKYGSKCGIYHVCCRFALEETYVCNLLALFKFGVNRLIFSSSETIDLTRETQSCLSSTKTWHVFSSCQTRMTQNMQIRKHWVLAFYLVVFNEKKRCQAFAVVTFSLSWFGIKFRLIQVVAAYFSLVLFWILLKHEKVCLSYHFWTKIVGIY